MMRSSLKRLWLLPIWLALANGVGFAYAWLARRAFIANSPFVSQRDETPFFQAYSHYLGDVLRLQFGELPRTGDAVAPTVLQAAGYSLQLLLAAFILSVGVGIGVGLLAARSTATQPPRVGRWLLPISTLGQALPSFYLGILSVALVIAWGRDGGLLPTQGAGTWAHLVLPTLALALRSTVQLAQITAHLLVGELGQPYVMAARAVGNSLPRARQHHALPNLSAPLIAAIANTSRWLIGELIIVEWLFNWPGLGRLLAQALIQPATTANSDGINLFLHPQLLAFSLMVLVLGFVVVDGVASALARWRDPRLRDPRLRAQG